jgi:hypothetical protein
MRESLAFKNYKSENDTYTLHVHIASNALGYTMHFHIASGGKVYSLHVNTAGGGKG